MYNCMSEYYNHLQIMKQLQDQRDAEIKRYEILYTKMIEQETENVII